VALLTLPHITTFVLNIPGECYFSWYDMRIKFRIALGSGCSPAEPEHLSLNHAFA